VAPSLNISRRILFFSDLLTEKSKYILLTRRQNAGQNHDIKIADRCFENMAQFRYLGTTITNENQIQEEIKRRLNSGNACYHSVQNLLSSRLLTKNIKIRIYRTIILPLVSDIKGGTWTEGV
jgi:ribosomal protein S2